MVSFVITDSIKSYASLRRHHPDQVVRVNVKRTLSPKAPLAETLFYFQKYCNIDEKNVKKKTGRFWGSKYDTFTNNCQFVRIVTAFEVFCDTNVQRRQLDGKNRYADMERKNQ